MQELYIRIKDLRLKAGLSQEELASKTGYTDRSSIAKIEKGEVDLSHGKIMAFAKALGVSPAYLMGWQDNPTASLPPFDNILPVRTKKFPLLGSIACGKPIFAEEDFQTFVEASADINADFCLQAKGDSMIGARILDGDIVFIRRQPQVENGQIAAVIIEDEATLKRVNYLPEKNMLILKAENPHYEDFVYIGEELNQINILGQAVAFQSLVR